MYQTSEKFKNAVYGDSRTFLAKISAGTHSASEEILSLKQTSRSVADDCISIGGAVSSYVEIKMWDPGFTLDGTELEISIGMTIGSEPEWVPLGLFTAQKPKTDSGVVTFTAYDRIQTRMSGAFVSGLTYPCDGKTVLVEMSKKTGVPIITANLPDGVMLPKRAVSTDSIVDESGNPVTDTKYVTPFDGYTYREALSYIAQFYGMFATMDRTGNVVFRWYTAADCSISADRYYDDLALGESVFTVEKIVCQAGNDILSAGEGTACMQLENPVMTLERLSAVQKQITGLEFLPASVSFLGDPRVDVGDIITVTNPAGEVVKIPVMAITQDFDGGLLSEVRSFGKVESEVAQSKGPTAQKLDRVYTDMFLVKEMVGGKANFDYVYGLEGKFKKLSGDYLSFKSGEFEDLKAKQADFETATAKNFSAQTAQIKKLSGDFLSFKTGDFENLKAKQADFETATAKNFTATSARIDTVSGDLARYKTIVAENFSAANGKIENLETTTLKAADAKLTYATIESLNALKGDVADLNVGKLTARVATIEAAYISKTETKQLLAGYADINLANVKAGTIDSALIRDGAITDAKIANVSANKLTAGTIDASKINVTNMNADNLTVGTINGQRIGDKSIDLAKLSKEVPTKEYLDSVQNGLQNQIDSAIQTYTTDTIPTLKNSPAVSWTDNSTRAKHVGDICYVTNAGGNADGYCYRFTNTGTSAAPVYEWVLIKDSDVNKALQELVTVNGDISGLKTFQSETSSWRTSTDSEISSVKTRTTTIETTYSTKEETKTAADSAKSSAIASAKGYTDTAKTAAIASSKSYTDTATKDMATSTAVANAKKEAIDTAAKDASSKASAAQSTAISEAAKDATSKADAAKSSAISAAASDATKKADAAKSSAISAAATDATTKANTAKSEAISTAASDATKKANDAKSAAISAASSDATKKANTAKSEAISAASSDATSKANAALNSAKGYADDAVDNIAVGGRNLLVKTNQGITYWTISYENGNYSRESITWLGVNAVKMSCSKRSTGWRIYLYDILFEQFNKLKPGGSYVLAYDTDGGSSANFLGLLSANGLNPIDKTHSQTAVKTSYGYHYTIKIVLNDTLTWNNQVVYFENNLGSGESVIIANIKLEEGNKATPWTPAPEDIDDAISEKVSTTVFNEVKQTVDANSATITKLSETVSKKADGSTVETLTNTVNTVKQTTDANTASISSLTTTVSKKADGSTVDTISKTLNTVKQTADSNSASISGLQTTVGKKADGSTVETLTNRVSTAEQNLDGFKTTVSKTYVTSQTYTEKVGALESGISAAQGTANTAKSTADAATTTANTAKSTADTASKTASAAKSTAEGAVSTANTAKNTADSASKTASSAKSTADSAVNTANIAKSTAEGAVSTANSAKSTADAASNTINRGLNKWLIRQFASSASSDTTIDKIVGKDIVGTYEYADSDLSTRQMGLILKDYYIGYAITAVKFSETTSIETAFLSDDGGTVYLNGAQVAHNVLCNNDGVSCTLSFKKGWNVLEVVWVDGVGADGFKFTTTISKHAKCERMDCYASVDTVETAYTKATTKKVVSMSAEVTKTAEGLTSTANKVTTLTNDLAGVTTRLGTAESKITQNAESISAKLSTTEFNTFKTNNTTAINDAKSSAISTAASDATKKANDAKSSAISTAASDATKKANDAKSSAISTAASDATTKANNAKSAAISTAASDATTKANDALSSAKSYSDGQIKTVNAAITQTNTEISAMKGQIALKVEQTDINKAIDEVTIGGKNIATKTNQGTTGWNWSMQKGDYTATEVVENGVRCCKLTRGSTAQSGWSVIEYANIGRNKWEPNTTYTVSVEVKASHNVYISPRFLCGDGTNGIIQDCKSIKSKTVTNAWTKLIWIVQSSNELPTRTDQNTYFGGMNSSPGAWYQFRNLKIEKGNKATDWTPAPEDDEERLSSLESWKSEASLKITKDGIIGTVGSYYATGADVVNLTGRVTAAESTIKQQSDSIALTVKKDSVISAINQTSESVKISANKISLTAAGLVEIINKGTTKIEASKLDLSGYVTISSLSGSGTTTIDGSNIKTGKISTDRLDVNGIFAKDVSATKLHVTGNSKIDGNLVTSGINASNITAGTISADRLDVAGIFAKDVTATGTITGATLAGSSITTKTSNKGSVNIAGDTISAKYSYASNKTQEMGLCADGLSFGETVKNGNSASTYSYVSLDQSGLYIQDVVHLSRSAAQATFSCSVVAPGLGVHGSADISNDLRVYGAAAIDKGLTVKNAGLELYAAKPYIDFHFGDSGSDYTSRIIELESGKLNINGTVLTNGGKIWGTELSVNGNIGVTGTLTASGTIKTTHSGVISATGRSTSWLNGAQPNGAVLDVINTTENILMPSMRLRTKKGAWVTASYDMNKCFYIYYANASRLGGTDNGTDAVYTFSADGNFSTKTITQTSDEREKNIISGITEKYEKLFMQLKPVLFNWKTNEDGIHMGFGAQTTLKLAEKCGIRENELAAVHKSKTEEPWSMSYTEIVPLAVQMTQKALLTLDSTRKEVSALGQNMTARMESLQYQLAQAFDRIAALEKENKSLRQALS